MLKQRAAISFRYNYFVTCFPFKNEYRICKIANVFKVGLPII